MLTVYTALQNTVRAKPSLYFVGKVLTGQAVFHRRTRILEPTLTVYTALQNVVRAEPSAYYTHPRGLVNGAPTNGYVGYAVFHPFKLFTRQPHLTAWKRRATLFYGSTILKVIRCSVGFALMIPFAGDGIFKIMRRGVNS
jgi:hypothetical protein